MAKKNEKQKHPQHKILYPPGTGKVCWSNPKQYTLISNLDCQQTSGTSVTRDWVIDAIESGLKENSIKQDMDKEMVVSRVSVKGWDKKSYPFNSRRNYGY
ncbi:MAG: hypothetical protein RAO94_00830 [Candidatus Stygibacter australis]|nr:hypothetical protein [Candidatus Stygibacter australis]MDP8320872.1 hypothetical protein [Candidatus Stygibacter australis]